ncbi:BTB/POZ domain-containing protein FBL11 isoform X1 [Iris pallida]|uniref:BTB/POZ domain-containing protein FBL11 isoform X1 n=1 Tax=Iris pallida TaxID=29817 RepID=A0AAX6GMP7_IRIPA|nr:BTB/POZ domain-containing protein FBL11 isoform X1 [Iris pallida]
MGISKLICKCRNIHSLILSFTSFGRNSVMTLCSIHTNLDSVHGVHHNHKYSDIMAFRLQQLHIDGCRGIDHKSMSQLMSHTYMLHILRLRDTCVVDDALYEFMGSNLESLDVSETMDCGNVTADGVTLLFNCIALEDLLLRHNGRGIGRNFISDAASKLPLLRRIALDLCDACEGGFDSPSHAEGFYLSNVRLSCCMPRKCGFDIEGMKPFKPIHKKTSARVELQGTADYRGGRENMMWKQQFINMVCQLPSFRCFSLVSLHIYFLI